MSNPCGYIDGVFTTRRDMLDTADGRVVRFPRIKQNQRVALAFKFAELRRTNPMLLSSYSHGGI